MEDLRDVGGVSDDGFGVQGVLVGGEVDGLVRGDLDGFEAVEGFFVALELAGDFGFDSLAVGGVAVVAAEEGVVFGVVVVEDFADDGHQRQEEAEEVVAGAFEVGEDGAVGRGGGVGYEAAGLPDGFVEGEEEVGAFGVEEGEVAVVAECEVAVLDVEEPPCSSAFFVVFLVVWRVELLLLIWGVGRRGF